jgi:hypothetical protein
MRNLRALLLFCCLLSGKLFAGSLVEIAGDLPKTVTADKSPYLVVADIYVPTGKTVVIEPGTVFLFKNFTGLHVRGTLIAKGTSQHPVVFSSENDKKYNKLSILNPTPFDWNGIYIHKDGFGTVLENIKVAYSVKGIFSEIKFIRIGNGIFSDNGRSDCTIESEEKVVQPMEPFTYSLSVKDATIDGVPVRILQDPDAPKRNLFRYAGIGVFVGGAVFAGVFGYQAYVNQKDLDKYSSKHWTNIQNPQGNSIWNNTRTDRNKSVIISAAGGALFLTGGAVFVYSFTF